MKVNADDKRQAAELIELDGGDLRREPLDSPKATFGVAAEARSTSTSRASTLQGMSQAALVLSGNRYILGSLSGRVEIVARFCCGDLFEHFVARGA